MSDPTKARRGLSRRNQARLVVYPLLVASVVGFVIFMTSMPGASFHGALPPLDEADAKLGAELRADVAALAGPGERSTRIRGTLAKSAAFVEGAMRAAGYEPTRLSYDADGETVDNLEITLAGGDRAKEIVIVGAHYDAAPYAAGADDNASGVAAMLALARLLKDSKPARTIRFVAFVNEEPPHFWDATMGSLVYAKASKARGDQIVAMLSLETLGYYRDAPGSQKYPPIVRWLYPDRGDFVAFVGNLGSRSLVRSSIRTFRERAHFPSEGAALPSFMTGVGWSDHWSFWQVGYPAVMVTDTAPFRNPNYHTAGDTPDTLDYDRLARVVRGLTTVIESLAR